MLEYSLMDTDTNVLWLFVVCKRGVCFCLFVFVWVFRGFFVLFFNINFYWCILLIHVVSMITVRSV